MIKSSLIQSFLKLSKKEIEKFLLFVKSPYYNSSSQVIKLTEYLVKHFNHYDEVNCDKKTIYTYVYTGNKFNHVQLRRLFSTTLKLLEEMLVTEYRKNNELQLHSDLLNVLIEKKLNKRVEKTIRKVERILEEKNKFRNSNEYYFSYKMLDILDKWYIDKLDHSKTDYIQKKIDALDNYYLIEKFSQSCVLLNRRIELFRRDNSVTYENKLIDELQEGISQNDYYNDNIILKIYYKVYKSLINRIDESAYLELCHLVEKYINLFNRDDGTDIYTYLLNFATKKINEGKTHFFPHIFKIQKSMLANGFLISNGVMSHLHYQNLVTTAHGLKEYKWAKKFIEKYRTYLPENIKDNAYNYNLAVYYCETNNYNKAHDLLINIEYTNLMYNLNARAMLLRVYFETDESTALEAHTSAFKVYLMRNKMINKERYRRYYNLFRYTEKLFKIKQDLGYEKKEILNDRFNKLLKRIDESGRMPFKRWLYKQTASINVAIS